MMYDTIFKVVFFGDVGVGSSTLLKYTSSDFIYDTTLTIGVDFWVKKETKGVNLRQKVLRVNGRTVKLLILRLSNEERFEYLLPRYVKAAHGAILMYDLTRPTTLEKIPEWTSIVRQAVGGIPIVLVGGKVDLVEDRKVSREKALEITESERLHAFIECDSKSGENIEEIFETLTKLMIQRSEFY